MENQNSEENNADGRDFSWFEKVEGIVESFVKGLAGGFADRIKERIQDLVLKIQKSVMGFFLVMIGLVFALVGIAMFVNDFMKISNGMGYAIVGFVILLLGFIIIKK